MTKAEIYEKAWKIALNRKDFSLLDTIYHQDYRALDERFGVEMNLEADKAWLSTTSLSLEYGRSKILFENDNFLCLQQYTKVKMEGGIIDWQVSSSAITYKSGKIITQKTVIEKLDYDPSENKDWNWESFE